VNYIIEADAASLRKVESKLRLNNDVHQQNFFRIEA
jgi:hypothetical protein